MKIALAQVNPVVGALSANHAKVVDFARRARELGAELVVFPELAICGYPTRDLVEHPAFVAECQRWLEMASQQVPEVAILCGCPTAAPLGAGKPTRNSALIYVAGKLLFTQHKMLLPTYDVFDELRYYQAAESQQLWQWQGRRLAITICEDAWNDKVFWEDRQSRRLYSKDPVKELMRDGADLMINISASPYCAGKIEERGAIFADLAREYRTPVLLVNQVGANDQLIFDGSSLVAGPDGRVHAQAAAFEEDLLVVDTNRLPGELVKPGAGESRADNDLRQMYRALVLGVRDYFRKCGFSQALIGLSGGVDSALVAAISVEALGAGAVSAVFMPSRFTSEGSRADAVAVATRLGIRLHEVSIEKLLVPALDLMRDGCLGESSNAVADDLADQNLQSRLRGLLLMAISNRTGALVLATGNKSEMAVGYCTLYGDMAGGLAVIADLLKTQVYAMARFLNRTRIIFPESMLIKPPSAELKFDQRDEDDLPPYDLLDGVIAAYVEENQSADVIAARLSLGPVLVADLIRRIDGAEYKRQQAAPGLRLSRKAFGTGRRLPIAQGYGPAMTLAAQREVEALVPSSGD